MAQEEVYKIYKVFDSVVVEVFEGKVANFLKTWLFCFSENLIKVLTWLDSSERMKWSGQVKESLIICLRVRRFSSRKVLRWTWSSINRARGTMVRFGIFWNRTLVQKIFFVLHIECCIIILRCILDKSNLARRVNIKLARKINANQTCLVTMLYYTNIFWLARIHIYNRFL